MKRRDFLKNTTLAVLSLTGIGALAKTAVAKDEHEGDQKSNPNKGIRFADLKCVGEISDKPGPYFVKGGKLFSKQNETQASCLEGMSYGRRFGHFYNPDPVITRHTFDPNEMVDFSVATSQAIKLHVKYNGSDDARRLIG